MDELAAAPRAGRRKVALTLQVGATRYPIVTQDAGSCLIRAPEGARLRGFADIYEGEEHRARCLIVLAAPEGEFIRLTYKRRSPALTDPPRDYARD